MPSKLDEVVELEALIRKSRRGIDILEGWLRAACGPCHGCEYCAAYFTFEWNELLPTGQTPSIGGLQARLSGLKAEHAAKVPADGYFFTKLEVDGALDLYRLGYARVSTANQKTELQMEKLKQARCIEIFEDPATSGAGNRTAPGFVALMKRAEELRAEGHEVEVCVSKLDRFSRSLEDLLISVKELGELGVSFRAIDEAFVYDANSAMSKLFLGLLGLLAEFERSLIRSRMDEGLAAKKAKGLKVGKKPKLTKVAVETIRAAYATGATPDQLAKDWKVSKSLVGRVLGIYPSLPPYITLDEWEAAKVSANT
ncbi:recombinase family protein [Microbacterium sp. 2RAF4]|uniref:recombinase family protein n=1 Tax=Microbacterium sp. 2RAF4 TaxID=3232999 RepID=UPI003F9AE7DA